MAGHYMELSLPGVHSDSFSREGSTLALFDDIFGICLGTMQKLRDKLPDHVEKGKGEDKEEEEKRGQN